MPQFDLLLGTGNIGKILEIKRSLDDLPIIFTVIADFAELQTPVEDGSSYEENAIIKARSYAQQTGMWTLADDSGLEVAYLNGLPGLRSARFGGAGLSDIDRTNLLLSKLAAVKTYQRSASFVSAVAVANPSGEIINVAHGICRGMIAESPAGEEGFGYDPVFIPNGHENTFAEMPLSLKRRLSHRGKALEATREFLRRFFGTA
ncbi:MAG TPA: RdgB/HAM1 family non-canonical purine NTP pyrophosphatase [Pyrinomonadaceae bacterium]|nr:RdgB/HAM1 family non-canonical purine NTP pyrophosphatase [Pyrinomonadaceae bacterium]